MCQDCGCSQGGEIQIHPDDRPGVSSPVQSLGQLPISGHSAAGHSHPLEKSPVSGHSHAFEHSHALEQSPASEQSHSLDHSHPHPHSHSHSHAPTHSHSHSHVTSPAHAHGSTHPHSHSHAPYSPYSPNSAHSPHHSPATQGSTATLLASDSLPSVVPQSQGRVITIEQAVLGKNDRLAAQNREYFQRCGVVALNILSSPGSGKTTLLEKTLEYFENQLKIGIVVGDLATDNDAQRLRKTAAPIVQITTGNLCHLEADMVLQAAQSLQPEALDLLVVENVGNLVCPAAYDLGERARVVLLSVTEGEDKPLKYPGTFKSADLVLLTKVDIAEAVGCDRAKALDCIHRVAPQATVLEVSARSGLGMDAWYAYLRALLG